MNDVSVSTWFPVLFYIIFFFVLYTIFSRRKKNEQKYLAQYGMVDEIVSVVKLGPMSTWDEMVISTTCGKVDIDRNNIQELAYNKGDSCAYMQYSGKKYLIRIPLGYGPSMLLYLDKYKLFDKQKTTHERIQQEKEQRKNKIIEFVKKNTGCDIESMYSTMEFSYRMALRTGALYKLVVPSIPTYTRGVVRGSLADNVSTIANAQKKADYDRQVDEHNKTLEEAYKHKVEFEQKADKIEDIIMGIPKHQEYLALHRKICSELKAELNKVGL